MKGVIIFIVVVFIAKVLIDIYLIYLISIASIPVWAKASLMLILIADLFAYDLITNLLKK